MCTLLLATRVWSEIPLLLAANRDERLDRPSAPAQLTCQGERRIFAPRDLLAGGTWLGLNDTGVLAGITNRFTGVNRRPDGSKRSRGRLVDRALQANSAEQAAADLRETQAVNYPGFHLLVADRSAAFIIWSDGRSLQQQALGPGLHILTERSFGAAPSKREMLLRASLAKFTATTKPDLERLSSILRTHHDPAFESTCVHMPELHYGTRSSAIITFGRQGPHRYLSAEGAPCSTPFGDHSASMRAALQPMA